MLRVVVACYFCIGVAGTWLARRYAMQAVADRPARRASQPRRRHAAGRRHRHRHRGAGGGVRAGAAAAASMRRCWPLSRVGLLLVAGIGWIDDHRPLVAVVAAGGARTGGGLFALAVADVYQSPWLGAVRVRGRDGADQRLEFHGRHQRPGSQPGGTGRRRAGARCSAAAGGCWAWRWRRPASGFLPFNFPRARIFLGDVGSGAMGFCSGGAGCGGRRPARDCAPGRCCCRLSVFLVDAGLTLLRRLLRGERWWTPHTQHAYQVWARRSGHNRVTLAYAALDRQWRCRGFWLASRP